MGADEPNEYRPGGPGGTLPNYRCYRRCSDGLWLFSGPSTSAFIRRGFEVIGAGHILEDPRIGGDPGRVRSPENLNWITLELDQLFTRRPRAEWLQMLESADVPVAPVLSADTWLDHEQVRATGLRAELRDDLGRPVTMPGVFVTLSDTPASIRRAAPVQPLPIAELAARWPSGSSVPSGSAAPADLPLRGIRVLDLGTVIAGPYLATLLGELGAEVVKVERPPHGDEYRVAHGGRGGVGFPVYNRGQRSLMLDLAQGGRAAFFELVRSAEVIVDNYRPGVLQRLQIDHDQLASVNPLLVSASVSAFGQRGPLGGRPGFDPVVQAMSGIMRSQGGQDESNSPVFLTVPINDVLAAGLGALGVCAALYARRRIGRGQQVSVTLCAAATLVQSDRLVRYEGRPLPGDGGRDFSGPGALKRLYRAADGWVRLDGDWPDDLPGLERAGLATAGLRQSATAVSPAAAVDAIAGSLADLPVDEVLRRALSVGVPAVRVRHARELAEDDQLAGQGLLDVTTPGEPVAHVAPGRWLQIPGLAQPPAGRAPEPGEHSLAVLLEAGLTRHEVSQLAKMEAVKLTATDALLVAEAAVNPTPD